jgi:hypothetical protein
MVDRKARIRRQQVDRVLGESEGSMRSIVQGVQQHLADDQAFHGSSTFVECCGEINRLLKRELPGENDHKLALVAHVSVELLLDAAIETEQSGTLDRYYQAIQRVPLRELEETVIALVGRVVTLEQFMAIYMEERFLFDYLEDEGLWKRINNILRRVSSEPLPLAIIPTYAVARKIIQERREQLLSSVVEQGCQIHFSG